MKNPLCNFPYVPICIASSQWQNYEDGEQINARA